LPGQPDHIGDKPVFICATLWDLAMRGTVLTQHATGPTLGNAKPISNLIDIGPATRGA
jgi:hypothetical protein